MSAQPAPWRAPGDRFLYCPKLERVLVLTEKGFGGRMNRSNDSRIAFVQSSWHEAIVDRCRASFTEETADLGVAPGLVDFYKVPGSFELPLHTKRLARTGRYQAIVAAGLIVDGGIYRHEFVAKAVIDGLIRVQLDEDVPVISAVLTPHHFHEHDQHTCASPRTSRSRAKRRLGPV